MSFVRLDGAAVGSERYSRVASRDHKTDQRPAPIGDTMEFIK